MKEKILVIDDDKMVFDSIEMALEDENLEIITASTAEDGVRIFRKSPDAFLSILVDNQYKKKNGETEVLGSMVVEQIRKLNENVQILMLSGDYTSEALKSWKDAGTDKYLWKPFQKEQLVAYINIAREIVAENEKLSEEVEDLYAGQLEKMAMHKLGIVGASKVMGKTAQKALDYANSDMSVMLIGETGTGKEVFAQGIHKNSNRKSGPFIGVDCTRYKDKTDLFESEMFGHVRGAFTGADKNKIGYFEAANNGTIFLDEIHHLSYAAQAKLLRAIQNKAIVRVGENHERPLNFRLIVAAKPAILDMVKSDKFLIDLFYRIYELDIQIPALKDRKEDIRSLILHFKNLTDEGKNIEFTKAAYSKLKRYDWPGNVRELQLVIKRTMLNTKTGRVTPEDISGLDHLEVSEEGIESIKSLEKRQLEEKKQLIQKALEMTKNNKTEASKILGTKRSTLNDFVRKYSAFFSKDTIMMRSEQ